jgi:hypothetical protein
MPFGLGARKRRKMIALLQATSIENNNEKQAQDIPVTL